MSHAAHLIRRFTTQRAIRLFPPSALPWLVSITPHLPKSIATSGAGDVRNREGGSSVMDESLGNILDRRMRNEKLSAPEKKKKEKLANG